MPSLKLNDEDLTQIIRELGGNCNKIISKKINEDGEVEVFWSWMSDEDMRERNKGLDKVLEAMKKSKEKKMICQECEIKPSVNQDSELTGYNDNLCEGCEKVVSEEEKRCDTLDRELRGSD